MPSPNPLHEEFKEWSDSILQMLAYEENCSQEFRDAALAELESRPDSVVELTTQMLHEAGSSGYQGWTRKQLEVLGVHWPPPSGWLKKMAGTVVPNWKWRKFLSLRGVKK